MDRAVKSTRVERIKEKLLSLFSGLTSSQGGKERKKSKFETTLEQLLNEHDEVVIGRLQMVNLQELIIRRKNAAELLEKSKKAIETVIEENLKRGESFVRQDIATYGFLFPGVPTTAAELRCAVIADQISRVLNDADEAFAELEFEKTTQKVNRRMLERRPAVSLQSRDAVVANYLDIRRHRDEERKRHLANRVFEQMALRKAPAAAGKREAPETNSRQDPDDSAPPQLAERLRIVYRPLWNVKTKLLTAYRAQPAIESEDGEFDMVMEESSAAGTNATLAALDRLVQRDALANLHYLIDAGHKVLLVLPVHFSTLDDAQSAAPFVRALMSLGEEQRRLVVLELTSTPREAPGFRIRAAVAKIRRATRSVMVRIPADSKTLSPWAAARVHAVGFDQMEETLEERLLMRTMETFVEQAEEAKLNAFVYGLTTLSMVTAAVYAGFHYIEGEAVRPPALAPSYVTPFESEDLFATLLGR